MTSSGKADSPLLVSCIRALRCSMTLYNWEKLALHRIGGRNTEEGEGVEGCSEPTPVEASLSNDLHIG